MSSCVAISTFSIGGNVMVIAGIDCDAQEVQLSAHAYGCQEPWKMFYSSCCSEGAHTYEHVVQVNEYPNSDCVN